MRCVEHAYVNAPTDVRGPQETARLIVQHLREIQLKWQHWITWGIDELSCGELTCVVKQPLINQHRVKLHQVKKPIAIKPGTKIPPLDQSSW